METEADNVSELYTEVYDFISSEIILEREKSYKRILRGTRRRFPLIKEIVDDAQEFAKLTPLSIDDEVLPEDAQRIRGNYFNRGVGIADLFRELVGITQELERIESLR